MEKVITLKEYEEEKGKLGLCEAGQVVEMLCVTLDALHRKQTIYRELCPENIILVFEGDGEQKLTEVRLAENAAQRQYREGAKEDTALMGIERYAAPEQYGFAQSMPATDIFAVGIIFNEMLTGKTPEEEKTSLAGCRMIIEKCCELDWKKRYQNVKNLERDLKRVLSGKESRIHQYLRERGRWVAGLTICGMFGIAFFFWLEVSFSKSQGVVSEQESLAAVSDVGETTSPLPEGYLQYISKDNEWMCYYPQGYHCQYQRMAGDGVFTEFASNIGDRSLLGVFVEKDIPGGQTPKEVVKWLKKEFMNSYNGEEIFQEVEENYFVYYYKVLLPEEEEDGVFGIHIALKEDAVFCTVGTFYERDIEQHREILDTVLESIRYK